MEKDRKGFQIFDGLGRSSPVFNKGRTDHSPPSNHEGNFRRSAQEEPGRNSLTIALATMERRLNGLLDDRRRVGRDLHDCVLQALYAIGLNLEASRAGHSLPASESLGNHDHIVGQLNKLIHDVRRMVQSLETGIIQEFDLVAELCALRATYERTGLLGIDLDLHPNAIEVLTNEEEQEILNIVREALSNCARHAEATQATVIIRVRGTRIRLSVSDDGVGFVTTNHRHHGYGLANMDARARKLGGTLRIRSAVGRGTTVIAEFSLEPILSSV